MVEGPMRVNEWQIHSLWPWSRIVLMDGTAQRGGEVCRRRAPDGNWQYRRLTPDEIEDLNGAKAW